MQSKFAFHILDTRFSAKSKFYCLGAFFPRSSSGHGSRQSQSDVKKRNVICATIFKFNPCLDAYNVNYVNADKKK